MSTLRFFAWTRSWFMHEGCNLAAAHSQLENLENWRARDGQTLDLLNPEAQVQPIIDKLAAAKADNATLRKALEDMLPLVGVVVHVDDYGKALERIKQARKALAATKPEGDTSEANTQAPPKQGSTTNSN